MQFDPVPFFNYKYLVYINEIINPNQNLFYIHIFIFPLLKIEYFPAENKNNTLNARYCGVCYHTTEQTIWWRALPHH
jgi:hypothetical protein